MVILLLDNCTNILYFGGSYMLLFINYEISLFSSFSLLNGCYIYTINRKTLYKNIILDDHFNTTNVSIEL